MKKKTKLHPLIVLVCPVLVAMLTYFINHFIEYGGDDYSYIIVGRILRQGILPFLQQNYVNWLNDNGRFLVHRLDSLFLIAP